MIITVISIYQSIYYYCCLCSLCTTNRVSPFVCSLFPLFLLYFFLLCIVFDATTYTISMNEWEFKNTWIRIWHSFGALNTVKCCVMFLIKIKAFAVHSIHREHNGTCYFIALFFPTLVHLLSSISLVRSMLCCEHTVTTEHFPANAHLFSFCQRIQSAN